MKTENMKNGNMTMETWNTTRLTHLTHAARKLCSKTARNLRFTSRKLCSKNCSKLMFFINDSARTLPFTSTVLLEVSAR